MKHLFLLLTSLLVSVGASAQTYSAELEQRAQAGDAVSMNELGQCYFSGLGVEADPAQAVRWWTAACKAGDNSVCNALGRCYEQGLGVGKSPAQAAVFYRKGARAGDREAILSLVACYRQGRGVGRDSAKADLLDAAARLVGAGDVTRALEFVGRALPAVTQPAAFEAFVREYADHKAGEWAAEHPDADEAAGKHFREQAVSEAGTAYVDLVKDDIRLDLTLKKYDPERKAFLVLDPCFGEIFVGVPESDAARFGRYWLQNEVQSPSYSIEDGRMVLNSLVIKMPYGTRYGYRVNPGEVADPKAGERPEQTAFVSDVDVDIPENPTDNHRTFVVVFANGHYRREKDSEYSLRDGEIFARYCHKTLGIPQDNIRFVPDATLNDMRYELMWLKNAVADYGGNAEIIVYYSGHGMSDPRTGAACLLPSDGYGQDLGSGLGLDELCDALSLYRSRSTLLILDASFAGVARDGSTLNTNLHGRLSPRACVPSGKMMVFTAAENGETAYVCREKGHGMMTYFLLKKLQQTRGEVTLGELSRYVAREVRERTWVDWKDHQTPRALVAITLSHVWKPIRLR